MIWYRVIFLWHHGSLLMCDTLSEGRSWADQIWIGSDPHPIWHFSLQPCSASNLLSTNLPFIPDAHSVLILEVGLVNTVEGVHGWMCKVPIRVVVVHPGAGTTRRRSHNEQQQQEGKHFGEEGLDTLGKLSSPSVHDWVFVRKTLTQHQRTSNFKGTFEVICTTSLACGLIAIGSVKSSLGSEKIPKSCPYIRMDKRRGSAPIGLQGLPPSST